jgi:cytochrome c oxidase assembly protein Cox11
VAPVVSVQISSDAAYLSWEAVPGATYYKVYKAVDPYGQYTQIGQTADTTFNITPLESRAFFKVVSGN